MELEEKGTDVSEWNPGSGKEGKLRYDEGVMSQHRRILQAKNLS